VAQSGNELNARIAATTSLDSAAMKTLAFVTTIFLPLSFVSSLFSISMFNWQASPEDGSSDHGVVSSRFWVYWVVSVPLTATTLVGWRLWWKRQKAHYAMEYPQVLRAAGEGKCARVKEA
jgi:glutamate-1-semialdehyde 2,1-aminomutase